MRITLDAGSNVMPYLGRGWAKPEARHIWATGQQSWLVLPPPPVRRRCLLSLYGWPHLQPGLLDRQRVQVSVNGHDVGDFSVTKRGRLVCVVPGAVVAGKAGLCVLLRHPDSARPSDFPNARTQDSRRLAMAYNELLVEELAEDVERIATQLRVALDKPPILHMAPPVPSEAARAEAAIAAAGFQSAGDDCEFGFVQRGLGLEGLGLFRFASISIGNLTRGVQSGFAGIATAESLDIVAYTHVPDHDYMGRETTYGMLYHTARMPDQIAAETLKQQEMQRLKFLARKFIEDVEEGAHLFVVKAKKPLLAEEIAGLAAALRARGNAALLWVREADATHPPGGAAWLIPGIMVGYIDRIGVAPLKDISLESWIALCRSAAALRRQEGAVSRS